MQIKRIVVALTAGVALLGLAACGSGGSSSGSGSSSAASAPASNSASAPSSGASNAAAQFGPACSKVPSSGPGSFKGMSTAPVATAASHNPLLSTLVTAVKKAGLVDTLNGAKGITVFAPVNSAFAAVPKDQLNALLANKDKLAKLLEGHVVGKKITPAELASGNFQSLAKTTITSSGSGDSYTVDGSAKVLCGNVQTANATVYLIDGILMPKS